ncbi:unnamed protein product [Owenia fusiformis]|uniref:alpha-1,2-Mannosidase n=1 Tax=Owenia fusiformis TaxID=6347 RepID=A0A8J1TXK0_OWEFU|nr:unnamed protein product [Owenia fusiformis]
MDRLILDWIMQYFIIVFFLLGSPAEAMSKLEKRELKEMVLEMFDHGYNSYMQHAYPADELMPLKCMGRVRGKHRSRGDIDDALGNFSLTLVDTLDSLVVLGKIEEFEKAVRMIIRDVTFDTDIVVSVFETNIRMIGGLLGGHVLADLLKQSGDAMLWYDDELLNLAKDLGNRLLPAFNTSTGIPFPRVNLRFGVNKATSRTGHEKDTCTACAGTMILEFAALSRLTGDPIYEEKARKAMSFLWQQRNVASDLVGTVINIHNGDWVRRDAGVGAGTDSYYEYLLKAYILLGDETYLDRFNKHYTSIMRYINQGPMLVDVHMHRPTSNSKNFMDSLLAFWPGLQVLKGDIKPAIEIHEMLYQVMQRHNFLPEAFTTDFRVHWGQHPLRPEFVESTYFLYKATNDPYYLEVGKVVLQNLNQHARVDCGFAAIKDVTSGELEDQMDSFVLAETFKYLYLLFAEKEDMWLDVDDFVFTTEAHLLPLTLSVYQYNVTNSSSKSGVNVVFDEDEIEINVHDDDPHFTRSCPNTQIIYKNNVRYAQLVRNPLKDLVNDACPKPKILHPSQPRLRASDFLVGNKDQMAELQKMGIRLVTMQDGRVQLLHTASEALTPKDAEDGMMFMQEMIELSKTQPNEVQHEPRVVQLVSAPYFGSVSWSAGPAQFGYDLKTSKHVVGKVTVVDPITGCGELNNWDEVMGKIAILNRGDCMFVDKARNIQKGGAIAGIVIDNQPDTSNDQSPLFAMSGDGKDDVTIPMVFLFSKEGADLREAILESSELEVLLGYVARSADNIMEDMLHKGLSQPLNPDVFYDREIEEATQEISVASEDAPFIVTLGENSLNVKGDGYEMKITAKIIPVGINPATPHVTVDASRVTITHDSGLPKLIKIDVVTRLPHNVDKTSQGAINQFNLDFLTVLNKRTNFLRILAKSDYDGEYSNIFEKLSGVIMARGNVGELVQSTNRVCINKLANELELTTQVKVDDDPGELSENVHEKWMRETMAEHEDDEDVKRNLLKNTIPKEVLNKIQDALNEQEDNIKFRMNKRQEAYREKLEKHYATELDLNEAQDSSQPMDGTDGVFSEYHGSGKEEKEVNRDTQKHWEKIRSEIQERWQNVKQKLEKQIKEDEDSEEMAEKLKKIAKKLNNLNPNIGNIQREREEIELAEKYQNIAISKEHKDILDTLDEHKADAPKYKKTNIRIQMDSQNTHITQGHRKTSVEADTQDSKTEERRTKSQNENQKRTEL